MKRIFSVVLCLALALTIIPTVAAATLSETVSYTALPQGSFENVALAKYTQVSTAVKVGSGAAYPTYYRNGAMLVDGNPATYWQSEAEWKHDPRNDPARNTKGAMAIIDLGAEYPIYKIELLGEKDAMQNYEIHGLKSLDETFTDSGDNVELFLYSNAAVLNDDGTPLDNTQTTNTIINWASDFKYSYDEHGGYVGVESELEQKNMVYQNIDLKGQKYRYIRIRKTANEAAKFAELRVYSIEPKLIDVTPTDNSKITSNSVTTGTGSANGGNLNDFSQSTSIEVLKPNGEDLRITYDLGASYYIRKAEIWHMQGAVNDTVFKNSANRFSVRTGATSSTDTQTIGGIDRDGGLVGDRTSFNSNWNNPGAKMIMECEPTSATQYAHLISYQTGNNKSIGFAEWRIFAEDRTPTQIKIRNVADWSKAQAANDGYVVDLGGYYNVKKLTATPNGSADNFVIWGDAASKTLRMTFNSFDSTSAAVPFVSQFDAITGETEYDVKIDNRVRYIFVCADSGLNVLSDLKVWVEDGKELVNIAEGKSSGINTNAGTIGTLTNGEVVQSWIAGNAGKDELALSKGSTAWIDLGSSRAIDSIAYYARQCNPNAEWERANIQIWGANSDDFTDAILIGYQGSTPFANGYPLLMKNNTGSRFRYIIVSGYVSSANPLLPHYYYGAGLGSGNAIGSQPNVTLTVGGQLIPEMKYEKIITEIQVFGEKKEMVEVGSTDTTSLLTDDKNDTEVNLNGGHVVTLDKYYPLLNITLDKALTSNVFVDGSTDGVTYSRICTFSPGSTEYELPTPTAYRYVKFRTTIDTMLSGVKIYTPAEYANVDAYIEATNWNDAADGTGSPLTGLTAPILGADITVKNMTTTPQTKSMIICVYDQDNLIIDMFVSTPQVIAENASVRFTGGVTNSGTPASMKVYFWDSVDAINPLTESISFE